MLDRNCFFPQFDSLHLLLCRPCDNVPDLDVPWARQHVLHLPRHVLRRHDLALVSEVVQEGPALILAIYNLKELRERKLFQSLV